MGRSSCTTDKPQRAELTTLRWRLFACAAVFSHAVGILTLSSLSPPNNAANGGTFFFERWPPKRTAMLTKPLVHVLTKPDLL